MPEPDGRSSIDEYLAGHKKLAGAEEIYLANKWPEKRLNLLTSWKAEGRE